MYRIALIIIALITIASSMAYARDTYVMAIAHGDQNPTIKVLGLDDPSNPYRDQYSLLDRWAFDNFARYMNDDNYWPMQMTVPEIEQGLKDRGITLDIETYRSVVELDASGQQGYLVPLLAVEDDTPALGQARTLGQWLLDPPHNPGATDDRPYFWSMGIQDEQALAQYREATAAAIAPLFPPLKEWMIAIGHEGDLYSFLPDGGLVLAVPVVKDDFSQRQAQLFRYDAEGKLLKQVAGDYMDWCSKLLFEPPHGTGAPYLRFKEHPEASGRNAGTSGNISSTGRFTTYINEQRDGFLAVIDYWQGKVLTPADGDLAALVVDPYPYFGSEDYATVLRVYQAQQALAAAKKPQENQ
jgi:hypothetical protein